MHQKGPGLLALAASLLILFVWIPLDVDTGIIEKVRRSVVLGDAFAPAIAALLIGIGGCLLLFEVRGRKQGESAPELSQRVSQRAEQQASLPTGAVEQSQDARQQQPQDQISQKTSTHAIQQLPIQQLPIQQLPIQQLPGAEREADQLSLANLKFLLVALLLLTLSVVTMRWAGPLLVALVGDEGSSYRVLRDTAPWKYTGFILGGVLLITGFISWVEGRFRLLFLAIGIGAVLVLIAIYDLPFDDLLLPPNGDV